VKFKRRGDFVYLTTGEISTLFFVRDIFSVMLNSDAFIFVHFFDFLANPERLFCSESKLNLIQKNQHLLRDFEIS